MIGFLPETLSINGRDIPINTDYRRALIVLEAFQDNELERETQTIIMLDAIIGLDKLTREDYPDAVKGCQWFLNGGRDYKETRELPKLIDWAQDDQMIFSAINNVAKKEVRDEPYLHWWTFLGYYNEIQEGLFTQVVGIRRKQSKGQKLEKYEKEFYDTNPDLVDLKNKHTKEEQEEIDYWNKILGD